MNNPIKSQIAANRERFEKNKHNVVKNEFCYFCTRCHETHGDGDSFIGKECPSSSIAKKDDLKSKIGGIIMRHSISIERKFNKQEIHEIDFYPVLNDLTELFSSSFQTAIAAVEEMRIVEHYEPWTDERYEKDATNKVVSKVVELLKGGI